MIKNRNLFCKYSNNSSADEEKALRLPQIATASLPTAGTSFEGMIAYDATTNHLVFCDGSNWVTIAHE